MEQFHSSERRREFVELIVIVFFLSIISNLIAAYIPESILNANLLNIPIGLWLILMFVAMAFIAGYYLVLTPQVVHVAIYANLLFDKKNNSTFSSSYAPFGIQRSDEIWKALEKDGSPLAQEFIKNHGNFKKNELLLDLFDYLVFSILTGFDVFWASGRIKSYGYPTHPHHLGEITIYEQSTVYVYESKPEQKKDHEIQEIRDIVNDNKLIDHFLGKTSLNPYLTPQRWMIFTPLGTKISVKRNDIKNGGKFSTITLENSYVTIELTIRMESTGVGLPYGIRIKEPNYNEQNFATTTFRIDCKASFSGWLSISPKMDYYQNWVQLIKKRLIANLALSRKGIIEEIE